FSSQSSLSSRCYCWLCDRLCSRQLLRRHVHHLMCHGLAAAEGVYRDRGRSDFSVYIFNVRNIRHVGDVGYIRYVPDVGHVHLAEVVPPITIPGHVLLAGAEWKPALQSATSDTNAQRKAGAAHEGN